MNKKVVTIIICLLALFLVVSVIFNFAFGAIALGKSVSIKPSAHSKYLQESVLESGSGGKKIALIKLEGIIGYSESGRIGDNMVEDFELQLKEAVEDSDVAAIILFIDSPGGEVTASDTLYRSVKKADAKKPVIAYMNSIAASGAYYTSMGARKIVVNELCITASIGVIMQTINYQHLADFIGIQTVTFKSGKMKDMLNPSRPVTEEERLYVQGLIDETYSKFVGIVAESRKIKEDILRNGIADGRIISGKKAVEEGLADKMGYLEDAVEIAQQESKTKNTSLIRYTFPFHFGDLFRFMGESSRAEHSQVKVSLLPEQIRLEAGKLYYLSPHVFSR